MESRKHKNIMSGKTNGQMIIICANNIIIIIKIFKINIRRSKFNIKMGTFHRQAACMVTMP